MKLFSFLKGNISKYFSQQTSVLKIGNTIKQDYPYVYDESSTFVNVRAASRNSLFIAFVVAKL